MAASPFPDQKPIKIPRATSLWVPFSRTVLVWILIWIAGFVAGIEVLGFFVEAVRADTDVAPVAAPTTGQIAVELAYISALFACLVAVPFGIWDYAEVIGRPSPLLFRFARLLLIALLFGAGAWIGKHTIMAEWTEAVMSRYNASAGDGSGFKAFSAPRYAALATRQMMLYGLALTIPVVIFVTWFRGRRERPDTT